MDRRDDFQGRFDRVLAAARDGELWARERIYEALSPSVAGFLQLGGSRDPDELTSEAFVGVLRNLATFDGNQAQFRSWVFTIAHRRLADERRRQPSADAHPAISAAEPTGPGEFAEPTGRTEATEPGEFAEPGEPTDVGEPSGAEGEDDEIPEPATAAQLARLCGRLGAAERDVVLLRLLGQLDIDEVAAALGRTSGAVRSLQHRGFAAVGTLADEEGVPL